MKKTNLCLSRSQLNEFGLSVTIFDVCSSFVGALDKSNRILTVERVEHRSENVDVRAALSFVTLICSFLYSIRRVVFFLSANFVGQEKPTTFDLCLSRRRPTRIRVRCDEREKSDEQRKHLSLSKGNSRSRKRSTTLCFVRTERADRSDQKRILSSLKLRV